jgi:hypothetical protein
MLLFISLTIKYYDIFVHLVVNGSLYILNTKSNSFMKYSIKTSSTAKVRLRYILKSKLCLGSVDFPSLLVLLKCGTFSIMMNFDYSKRK